MNYLLQTYGATLIIPTIVGIFVIMTMLRLVYELIMTASVKPTNKFKSLHKRKHLSFLIMVSSVSSVLLYTLCTTYIDFIVYILANSVVAISICALSVSVLLVLFHLKEERLGGI